jgi:hypothetical protein
MAHGPRLDASNPLSTGVAEIKIVPANPASGTATTNGLSGRGAIPATNNFAPSGNN